MSLIILFPLFVVLSIVCLVLFSILRLKWKVNSWFLIIFPLIVIFPMFLLCLGILIDYYDVNRRLKPLKFTVNYAIATLLIAILSYLTNIVYLMYPSIGILLLLFIDLGIYIRRFYVNDKRKREAFNFCRDNETDEEKNIGITYGKVRK